ncbi:lysophospholipase [Nocardia sp. CA2R105]|uniref:alpha/beta hydrolase n=1 Tax=Nocardia coffeae TaxID=2873381 RepID=UPI001CA6A84F|nr:alpha/beta fold hydrolase [Nocardia coffeae]MBY8862969.1 lysophospholipase [Nocardia coffeae]
MVAEADGHPRALVLALHGGGMTAGYFHGSAHPDLSLLTLGRSLGFSVVALDRPGYGHSSAAFPAGQSLREQTTAVFEALDSFTAAHPIGAGVFIVGHSMGLTLALHMAATPRGRDLLGIDGSGAIFHYQPGIVTSESPSDITTEASLNNSRRLREIYWGADRLYPPGTFEPGVRPTAAVPTTEARESAIWTAVLPSIAAEVRVPYQLSVSEYERCWRCTDADLAEYSGLFTAAPVMEIRRQPAAGHNMSLGWAARSYHLSALAFAERCLYAQKSALDQPY